LWMRWWTFSFHKMRGISWVAEFLLAFQEKVCCMELFSRVGVCVALWCGETFSLSG
jgi:hypothetical protein